MGDYEKGADLNYGAIPDLKAYIQTLTQREEARKPSESEILDSDSMESEMMTPAHITEVVSRWMGIPVNKLNQTDRDRLLKLEDRLKMRVNGQDQAIKEVLDCILRSCAG